MPYIIAFVIIIVAAGAILLFRAPVDTSQQNLVADARLENDTSAESNSQNGQTSTSDPDEAATPLEAEMGMESETETAAAEPVVIDQGADGTYVGEASYSTGRAVHELDVTLTIENDVVIAAEVAYDGGEPPTPILRSFDEAYQAEVVGKNIDNIQLSRVGGASWTSDAFNEAVAEVRAQI